MKNIVFLVVVSVITGGALAGLPCNSRLRIVRPSLFKHCGVNCNSNSSYGLWSSWKIISKVKSDNCDSGKAFIKTRIRHSFTKSCSSKTENGSFCECLIIINL